MLPAVIAINTGESVLEEIQTWEYNAWQNNSDFDTVPAEGGAYVTLTIPKNERRQSQNSRLHKCIFIKYNRIFLRKPRIKSYDKRDTHAFASAQSNYRPSHFIRVPVICLIGDDWQTFA